MKKRVRKVIKRGAKASFNIKDFNKIISSFYHVIPIISNISYCLFTLIERKFVIDLKEILLSLTFFIIYILLYYFVRPIKIKLPKLKISERRKGPYYIGKIISYFPSKRFFLNEGDLKKHVFISGLTGMGKSTLVQMIVKQIIKINPEKSFLLLEFKGEYSQISSFSREIVTYQPGINYSVNIFDPLNENPKIYAEKLLNLLIFCQIITFQDEYSAQMEKILYDILECVCSDENRRNWNGFDHYSEKIHQKNKQKIPHIQQTIISIHNRLRRLKTGPLKSVFEKSTNVLPADLNKHKIVMDLSSIIRLGGTKNDAVFFANTMFNSIWSDNLSHGVSKSIRHFTIIEDAQFFLSEKAIRHQVQTNYLEDFALLLRGTGECLITINTRPNISEDVIANAGVIIAFQLSYDQVKMAKLLSLNEEKFNILTKLKIGECLVKVNSISTPFLIKVPNKGIKT